MQHGDRGGYPALPREENPAGDRQGQPGYVRKFLTLKILLISTDPTLIIYRTRYRTFKLLRK